MIRLRFPLTLIVSLALTACIQRKPAETLSPLNKPAPRVERGIERKRLPDIRRKMPPFTPNVEKSKPLFTSPAVVALMSDAERQGQRGNLERAATTIERALRIQSRNAELWHRLAALRLRQQRPRLAEDIAKKSNALAGDNNQLKRKNWTLIASIRRKLGNKQGAYEAEKRANRY